MKNLFILNKYILTLLCLSVAKIVSSQNDTLPRCILIIKTDILIPSLSALENKINFGLTVEYGFKQRNSLQATYIYNTFNIINRHETTQQIIPEYKIFLTKKKPYSGFYSGIYGKYYYRTVMRQSIDTYIDYKYNFLGGGLIFGYQNYLFKRIVFDVLFGLGAGNTFGYKVSELTNTDIPKKNNFLDGRAAINIGYRF